MVAAQFSLIVVGLLAQLVGIGLAMWEVRQRRTYVQEYRELPITLFPQGMTQGQTAGSPTVTGDDEPPSPEERVATLEQDVWPAIGQAERRALAAANAHADTAAEGVHLAAQQAVDGVRNLLLRVTEPTWPVWTSLGLLVFGVALQSLASALGVDR